MPYLNSKYFGYGFCLQTRPILHRVQSCTTKSEKNEKYLKLLLLVLIKLETGVAHPIKIMKQACKEKSEIWKILWHEFKNFKPSHFFIWKVWQDFLVQLEQKSWKTLFCWGFKTFNTTAFWGFGNVARKCQKQIFWNEFQKFIKWNTLNDTNSCFASFWRLRRSPVTYIHLI